MPTGGSTKITSCLSPYWTWKEKCVWIWSQVLTSQKWGGSDNLGYCLCHLGNFHYFPLFKNCYITVNQLPPSHMSGMIEIAMTDNWSISNVVLVQYLYNECKKTTCSVRTNQTGILAEKYGSIRLLGRGMRTWCKGSCCSDERNTTSQYFLSCLSRMENHRMENPKSVVCEVFLINCFVDGGK